ncbi:MAG: VWA domain-containing protein [Terriglobales bacterium]|jgi:VWFA-related protein
MPRAIHRIFRAFTAVLLLSLWMSAQQPAAQNTQQQPTTQQNQDQDQEPITTLRRDVNVVNLFFNVKDKHSALIPDLTKADFELNEDGKPQTIKYFAKESDLPLTLGIMIDTSPSQMRVLPMEQDAGAEFLRDVMRPKDLAFLLSFDVEVDLLRDLTSNYKDIEHAMAKTRINAGGASQSSIPGIGQGPIPTMGNAKGTLLYDAVYLASREVLSHEVGRKAMIILTDGQDQGSNTRLNEAVEIAQKADAIVYVILCADRDFYGGGYYGDREMRKLTEETGGRVIDAGNHPEKMRDAFAQLANELRNQYAIGYTPTNQTKDGSFRKVEIRVPKVKDAKIQARKGYYAPRE